jgi:hypothetical protein
MFAKRLSFLLVTVAISFVTLTCKDQGQIASPVEPQFAKPIKPVPVEPVEPKLVEFWVHEHADCEGGMIHVAVSGDFLRIETNVSHDYWFNGILDRRPYAEDHWEMAERGPAQPPTEWNEDRTLGHIDVCFKGERIDYVYGDGSGGTEYFVDSPATSVGGTGADPFAFAVWVVTSEKQFEPAVGTYFRPEGVIVGGVTGEQEGESVTSAWHDGESFADVRSYAVFQPETAKNFLYFDALELDATCQVVTIPGRNKKTPSVTTTTITAVATFGFGSTGEEWPSDGYLRTESHLRVSQGGNVKFFSGPLTNPLLLNQAQVNYTWTTDVALEGDFEVKLLTDFLAPAQDYRDQFVYDPGENTVSTTAGFDGGDWNATDNLSTTINDGNFPVAHSNVVTVTCGQG